jgi:hypothetical protein
MSVLIPCLWAEIFIRVFVGSTIIMKSANQLHLNTAKL